MEDNTQSDTPVRDITNVVNNDPQHFDYDTSTSKSINTPTKTIWKSLQISEYEKIREQNIKEIQEAMVATLGEISCLKQDMENSNIKTNKSAKQKKKFKAYCQFEKILQGQKSSLLPRDGGVFQIFEGWE